jgi:uncharacterized protein (UPF0218 family)
LRRITSFQREEGKFPLGLLIEGSFEETISKLKELLKTRFPPVLISVGDAVSESMVKNDIFPDLLVVDNKVMRKSVTPFSIDLYNSVHVRNLPGTLADEAVNTIQEVLKKGKCAIKIVVDGEEDLLTLPAILYAPTGSLVVYGQPQKGIVIVWVTEQEKEKVRKIIDAMEYLSNR